MESLESKTVLDILDNLFAQYGKPATLVTDNASTFTSVWENGRHVFTESLKAHGIEHRLIPAYYPEANGKAEAAVNIAQKEAILPFFKEHPDWTIESLQALLDRFQEYDNFDRLHGGIGWQILANRSLKDNDRPRQLENVFFIKEPKLEFQFC